MDTPHLADSSWAIHCWFVLFLFSFVLLAKLVSSWFARKDTHITFSNHLWALSLASPGNSRTSAGRMTILQVSGKAVLLIPLLTGCIIWSPQMISPYTWWIQAYLSIIPFWIIVESCGLAGECLSLIYPYRFKNINEKPWLSSGLSDFWGNRWNRLISDWLKQVCFVPIRRHPKTAVILTFILSGLVHEFVVSIPLWLAYKVNCFGWMILYFLIQALGILIERHLKPLPRPVRIIFAWSVILLPVPLILNPGTLCIFHLALLN